MNGEEYRAERRRIEAQQAKARRRYRPRDPLAGVGPGMVRRVPPQDERAATKDGPVTTTTEGTTECT